MKKYEKAVLIVSKLLLNNKVSKQEIEDLIKKYESNKNMRYEWNISCKN